MSNTILDYKFDTSLSVFKLKKSISTKQYKTFFEQLIKDRNAKTDVVFDKKQTINSVQCIFSSFLYDVTPSCLVENDSNQIKETKIAYLLVLEFMLGNTKYIGFQSKNITGLSFFDSYREKMEYSKLVSLINEKSKIRKVNMKNTDISDYALLEKSYISQDLSKNISGFNLYHYALSSCRYFEDSKILSVTFNASRFSKVGCKVQIGELTEWFKDIIGDIDSSITGSSNNLVNSFAEYVNYQKGKYIPNAVLFLGYKLLDELEQNEDIVIEKKEKSKYKELEYDELVAILEKTNSFISIENGNIEYKELNDRCKITKAEIFNGLYIKDGPESKRKLLVKHFDKNNFFTLSYKDAEYRYFNGSLYKDSKLLNSIDWVMNLFFANTAMNNVKSEKGWGKCKRDSSGNIIYDNNHKRKKDLPTKNDKSGFPKDSEFYFVEQNFMDKDSFFICDDMNEEWADHIKILPKEHSVTFYLSKFSDHKLSATAFQDIIGQAQKNIGNFILSEEVLKSKEDYWKGNYESSGFSRMRNSQKKSSKNAVKAWSEMQYRPDYKKEMVLIINFIERNLLEKKLQLLKNKKDFSERNEVYQILWFISSLLGSCNEQNVSLKIICKP